MIYSHAGVSFNNERRKEWIVHNEFTAVIEKDEDWYKQYVEAITNYSVNSSYDMGYGMMNESYESYMRIDSIHGTFG